ncbi:24-hydroxycholesterol 7-alpha-hydroxylase-like [Watersipora subatra]|uniref:24-hydroxycholesterol 7-alpha-hydroxylase-like n=1 Tax=Watersipora subatra TaxID=2589382 RepID=UPI00355AF49A
MDVAEYLVDGAVILPLVVGFLLWGYIQVHRRQQLNALKANLPPCHSGWIPFLGCAISFGKEPLMYIKKINDELGPVFTLYITGNRMTYLTEEEDYSKYFLQSEYVDFQKAVHLFVANAADISSESFMTYHTSIHDMVKGKLATQFLPEHSVNLTKLFGNRIRQIQPEGKVELNEFLRMVLYPCVISDLFGKETLDKQNDEKSIRQLMEKFVEYDDQFEYGTQIPQIFLRKWASAKHWLLNMFKDGILQVKSDDKTVLRSLKDTVDEKHSANYGLLMLWASLANAIPVAFWTVALVLHTPEVHEKVKSVIADTLNLSVEPEFTEQVLHKLKYIRCCFLEAIRIRSPGVIIRMVIKPFQVKGYTVPAGDLLMLSPYWAHRNETFFPEPERFYPERWIKCDFSKNEFLPGFVAFGGGRYMCPGRWYALMELHILISLLFYKFDMKLEGKLPNHNIMHLVGVQQPDDQCYINMQPRS